jgi:hypothetical protein
MVENTSRPVWGVRSGLAVPQPACPLVLLAVEPVSRLPGRNIANASPDPTTVFQAHLPAPRKACDVREHWCRGQGSAPTPHASSLKSGRTARGIAASEKKNG